MSHSEPCLPGTEPITDRVLAERRAALPLKPKAPQRPCDHGLFSDEASQLDLVDAARLFASDNQTSRNQGDTR
jgi:hypothetical protein